MIPVGQRIPAGSVYGSEYVCGHRSLVKPTQFCPVSGVSVRVCSLQVMLSRTWVMYLFGYLGSKLVYLAMYSIYIYHKLE